MSIARSRRSVKTSGEGPEEYQGTPSSPIATNAAPIPNREPTVPPIHPHIRSRVGLSPVFLSTPSTVALPGEAKRESHLALDQGRLRLSRRRSTWCGTSLRSKRDRSLCPRWDDCGRLHSTSAPDRSRRASCKRPVTRREDLHPDVPERSLASSERLPGFPVGSKRSRWRSPARSSPVWRASEPPGAPEPDVDGCR